MALEPNEVVVAQPWAKSPDKGGLWLTLEQHMRDSAAVGRWLIDEWLPQGSLAWGTDNGWSAADVRRVCIFEAAGHDIGKATPAFSSMNPELYQKMATAGLDGRASVSGRQCHHTRTGSHLLLNFLQQKGIHCDNASSWTTVTGGHHGLVPNQGELNNAAPSRFPDFFGWDDPARKRNWQEVTNDLLGMCWDLAGMDDLDGPLDRPLPLAGQIFIGGLVIMADWIASNTELFPLGAANPDRAQNGIARLGLPGPWTPATLPGSVTDLFAERFDLLREYPPRPVQIDTAKAAQWLSEPGLVIVEAQPGEGKTEAALVAAEILAQKFDRGGVFVALPTQATTDAMFSRVLTWLDHFDQRELPIGSTTWLGHGRRRLNREFQGLPTVRLGTIFDDDSCREHNVAAHEWLTRKKSILATTVVGTIDQLLLAALPLKHGVLRFLGLTGKVVVIDEVHAYDPFMRTHLCKLLAWLAELKVPVVMLSATLPSHMRTELINAYAGSNTTGRADGTYPIVTAASPRCLRTWEPASSSRRTDVHMERLASGDDAVVTRVSQLLTDGGCALIVRNTVSTARATADALRAALDCPVEVHHARFTAADRSRRDASLLERFGPHATERPAKSVIVATQVAEMSLDVDFDVLLTDLAPMDSLIQRMGRCHRHERTRPAGLTEPRCVVLTDLDPGQPPELPSGSASIYGTPTLLASAAAIWPLLGRTFSIPDDVAPSVERAYARQADLPASWQNAHDEARAKLDQDTAVRRRTANAGEIKAPSELVDGFSGVGLLTGWLDNGSDDGDETSPRIQAAVRDGRESIELILLENGPAGLPQVPQTVTGAPLAVDPAAPPSHSQADAMAGCVVRITPPPWRAAVGVRKDLMNETPLAWRDEPALSRLPVLTLSDGSAKAADAIWTYSPESGLEVTW
ncbi:MAG: CRISPR-associated helicase Cas3' [Nostocoides sp.]